MADQSSRQPSAARPGTDTAQQPLGMEQAVEELTAVLLAVARGDFGMRAARDYSGGPIDVLSYLVNSTAEEVGQLVAQLRADRLQLQATRDQLIQTAKLAALGELAAGVAHELNQPLTSMGMLVDLLLLHPDVKVEDRQREFEMMTEAVRRMGRIVDNVRLFGCGRRLERGRVAADKPMRAALELMKEQLHQSGISVNQEFIEPIPELMANDDHLHQVFLNLLTNARDALREMDEQHPRRVTVRIGANEQCVTYIVEDTGPGVREDDIPRIFDPFFTTKEVGQGTGLGLSLSHGIILEHGGTMRYERATSGGARFVVTIPTNETMVGAGGS